MKKIWWGGFLGLLVCLVLMIAFYSCFYTTTSFTFLETKLTPGCATLSVLFSWPFLLVALLFRNDSLFHPFFLLLFSFLGYFLLGILIFFIFKKFKKNKQQKNNKKHKKDDKKGD